MDDLIHEFIAETTESLSVLDHELVKLEKNPRDATILGHIFRVMHTIKGTCGFLGLPRLESIAHASENVLGKIRAKELDATPEAISLVLESLDTIKSLIGYLSSQESEQPGDDSELIGRLNLFADTGTIAAKGAPLPTAAMPEAPEPATPETKDAAAQSIRVSLSILETLMQTVSELVLTRNQLLQLVRIKEDRDFMPPLQQLSHITTELQDSVMKTRMQPISNAWAKFPRMIRDLSHELGKKIELKMTGGETELDRQLLEVIRDPLTHMVRNSCDHGLETPEERRASGKPETGHIALSAYHEGDHIVIEIKDDGRGINIDKLRLKALTSGLATKEALEAMNEQQVAQLIFHPGLTTADTITSLSGRGVGMDVVKTNIESTGGTIALESHWGKGLRVIIKIPLTLAIIPVLLVETAGQTFAIPQINVSEVVRVGPGRGLSVEAINNALVLRLRNKLLPLTVLSKVLGAPTQIATLLKQGMYLVVCKFGGHDFGILVERVHDTQEIVVKPVASILKHISVYSGNTILGDGSVIMILDPGSIARSIGALELSGQPAAEEANAARNPADTPVGFLLFSTMRGAPKAVPLELVSRLEEIQVGSIEIAGDQPVVQYRGELMRLTALDTELNLPDAGTVEVIVFSYDRTVIGLVVKDIIDIAYAPLFITPATREMQSRGYLGSMVLAGRTTDIVDVGHLLAGSANQPASAASRRDKAAQCRVLLVEDSPFFRNLLVPVLAAAGYSVTAAETAEDALAILREANGAFDMIVTDLEMPGMDGFEFANACRNTPQTRHIPIIACTTALNDGLLDRIKTAGMNDCILKTDRTGLLDSVSRWLIGDIPEVRH